jgi:hypothetical protein
MMNFEEANKVVHPVESQWHYPILTAHGYIAQTAQGVGFVRSYRYIHPTTNRTILCVTGSSSDYWEDELTNDRGYWSALNPHLIKIEQSQSVE